MKKIYGVMVLIILASFAACFFFWSSADWSKRQFKEQESQKIIKPDVEIVSSTPAKIILQPKPPVVKKEKKIIPNEVEVLINKERAKNDLKTLIINEKMRYTAKQKVKDMIDNDYFAHISPITGLNVDGIFTKNNIKFVSAQEILAMDYKDSEVVKAWMESPTHKDVITDNYIQEFGCYSSSTPAVSYSVCHFIYQEK